MPETYPHGGNLFALSQSSSLSIHDIIDFSVNVRPEGVPSFIQTALWQAIESCDRYPSPHGEEVLDQLSQFYTIGAEHIVLGNGANELIAQIGMMHQGATSYIIQPAFASYERACHQANHTVISIPCLPQEDWAMNTSIVRKYLNNAPHGALVFLANPSNPVGQLTDSESLLSLIKDYPHLIWILDEAFIDYADIQSSLLSHVAQLENLIVLRSLTKFYGVAGVRLGVGFLPKKLKNHLLSRQYFWNINSFALRTAQAVCQQPKEFHQEEVLLNRQRRENLYHYLSKIPNCRVIASTANYLCFSLPSVSHDFLDQLLQRHHIALRNCSNYQGMDDGNWFRAGVRTEEDHLKLYNAILDILHERKAPAILHHKKPALMIQGTCSDAGKSILTTAFCRILLQDGYRVAPFKAQNMALNSGVTANGLEMGRAQIVQAKACLLDPDVRMNPILLKPHSQTGSQLVVMGKARRNLEAQQYFRRKKELWKTVKRAYDSLADESDIIVLEGAGSPGEVNLKTADIVNMNMAKHAQAKVLLAGDIDRGGVYASFLGTWMTFNREERDLLAGFLINKFRGDASLLAPANQYIEEHTGKPIWGVIPMIRHLNIPEEDRAIVDFDQQKEGPCLDVALLMPNHVSNFTDFAPLAAEPDVQVRMVREPKDWGNPDIVIIPGSKNVVHDFKQWEHSGLVSCIQQHARDDKWIFAVCGGLQMLGHTILDPNHIESAQESHKMLGLLDLVTHFAPNKTLIQVQEARTPLEIGTSGYEIHHGISEHGTQCSPLFFREDGSICGYGQGKIWATYLHGCLDNDAFRRAWIDHMKKENGLEPLGKIVTPYDLDGAIDRLADMVRERVNIQQLYRTLGLS